jgi:hypothetical protein
MLRNNDKERREQSQKEFVGQKRRKQKAKRSKIE